MADVVIELTPQTQLVVPQGTQSVVEVSASKSGPASVVVVPEVIAVSVTPSGPPKVIQVDTGHIGATGATGNGGSVGPAGPAGPAGGAIFEFIQSQPSEIWFIDHNLGRYPSGVSLIDSAKRVFEAEIRYIDPNSLTVTMSGAQSGTAYIS